MRIWKLSDTQGGWIPASLDLNGSWSPKRNGIRGALRAWSARAVSWGWRTCSFFKICPIWADGHSTLRSGFIGSHQALDPIRRRPYGGQFFQQLVPPHHSKLSALLLLAASTASTPIRIIAPGWPALFGQTWIRSASHALGGPAGALGWPHEPCHSSTV
jgi:hypothetical protein